MILTFPGALFARVTGTINGDVSDPSGATLLRAVALATQQLDWAGLPRVPLPARMDEVRKVVNGLRVQLATL
jgi:hypothetical protein